MSLLSSRKVIDAIGTGIFTYSGLLSGVFATVPILMSPIAAFAGYLATDALYSLFMSREKLTDMDYWKRKIMIGAMVGGVVFGAELLESFTGIALPGIAIPIIAGVSAYMIEY